MPINAHPEYFEAEAKFHDAETTQDKIKALRYMLSTAPTHKGAQKLRAQIKKQIVKYQELLNKEKRSGKGKSYAIKREGACQIVIIGPPNSGKSTLLSQLSGKKVHIAEYEFTTSRPEMRMIPYENIWLQGIEIPAIYQGYHDTKLGRQMIGIIRNADFILVVLKEPSESRAIIKELREANIRLSARKRGRDGFVTIIPSLTITRKDFDENLTERLWKAQRKIRVQTRTGGKIADKPIVMNVGATVEDAARIIHKDFIKKFRFARIWGPSARFDSQQVGFEHKLKDGDVIEVFTQ